MPAFEMSPKMSLTRPFLCLLLPEPSFCVGRRLRREEPVCPHGKHLVNVCGMNVVAGPFPGTGEPSLVRKNGIFQDARRGLGSSVAIQVLQCSGWDPRRKGRRLESRQGLSKGSVPLWCCQGEVQPGRALCCPGLHAGPERPWGSRRPRGAQPGLWGPERGRR